jgi:benzoate membrane transport protein
VGFFGSVALVLEAARAVGADADQATSWVVALCVAIAVTTLYLSLRHRMPIVTAWSTPGAAVIAAGGAGIGINEAVGVFIVAALLVVATAMIRPFGQLVERIPKTLAAAMLAGILLPFCLEVALQIPVLPLLVLLLVAVFFLVQVWSQTLGVPIILALGIAVAAASGLIDQSCCTVTVSHVQLVSPEFRLQSAIGLALPLYIVTMASQNLAGLAVLKADGYSPSARSCFGSTGIVSLLATPFGGHGVCLAAITAAICTGPAVDPDSDRRWRVGPVYALCYLVFAVFSESMVELLLALPAALIATFVGLALFGPLVGSVKTALAGGNVETKAAVVTFVVAASGVTFAGVGAAPWSLAAGLAILALHRMFDRPKAAQQ